ncbi:MAG: OmpA family protein [Bdellovibrionaceae bacterium]|nr:OmpA family protein [Pseudobdellovibrionaceae bacterium]
MKNRRQRHISHQEVDSEGSWAISYGDMVTLLLTFFIIFFTTDKFEMQKSLKLDVLAKQAKMSRDIASVVDQAMFPDKKLQDEVHGRVYQDGQRVIIEFSGVSFFRSGQTELTKQAKASLQKFYDVYAPHMGQYSLGIRSFTDTRKIPHNKYRFQDNLELSALRSISVMRFFQKAGVPLSNMKLSGNGELKLSENDLENIPASDRKPSSVHDLARTAVLVIEPRGDK